MLFKFLERVLKYFLPLFMPLWIVSIPLCPHPTQGVIIWKSWIDLRVLPQKCKPSGQLVFEIKMFQDFIYYTPTLKEKWYTVLPLCVYRSVCLSVFLCVCLKQIFLSHFYKQLFIVYDWNFNTLYVNMWNVQRWTDGRTPHKNRSEKPTWAFSSVDITNDFVCNLYSWWFDDIPYWLAIYYWVYINSCY